MSQEPAPHIIACSCGQKMKVPGNATGKTFKCVKCGAHVQFGADTGAAAPPPAPAPVDVPAAMEPVGQLLVQAGCITQLQLDEALAAQKRDGGKTFEILIRLGYLDKDRLHEVLSKQSGVAAIDLSRVSVDRDVAKLIPKDLALGQLVLPIDKLGKLLTVAMACPLDVATIAAIEQLTGLKVKAMLCKFDDIEKAVKKQFNDAGTPEGELHTFQLPPSFEQGQKEDISDKLGRMEELHYRVDVLDRVAALLKDPATGLGLVLETILHDPAFAAALLRTANNSVFGMPGQVDSLTLAVTLLGRNGLTSLVAACKKVNAVPPQSLAPLYERSLSAGKNAAIIARATGRVGHELALTAALLHGIGSFAMATAASQRYGKLKTDAGVAELVAEERKVFTIGHPEAAAALLKRWRFPESLQLSIAQYQTPDGAQKYGALATIVRACAGGDLESAAEAAGAKPDAISRGQREEEKLWEMLRTTRL